MADKTKYQYTDDMGEISGMGGGYEATCRAMVVAGLNFWDARPPDFDPHFRGYEGVYGILSDDNADAKALSDAVVAGADGDCTGAMHQASIGHIMAVRRLGWDGYCAEMRKSDEPVKAE
ncbi:MAG: hypothetical protein ACR2KM_08795 [Gemmatimonadaceae bacterium]